MLVKYSGALVDDCGPGGRIRAKLRRTLESRKMRLCYERRPLQVRYTNRPHWLNLLISLVLNCSKFTTQTARGDGTINDRGGCRMVRRSRSQRLPSRFDSGPPLVSFNRALTRRKESDEESLLPHRHRPHDVSCCHHRVDNIHAPTGPSLLGA